MGHVEGRVKRPTPYAIVDGLMVSGDGKTPATEDQIEAREKWIKEYDMKEYLACHIIINSVSLSLAQSIGQLTSVKDMWEAVAKECEGKTLLYQVDMH